MIKTSMKKVMLVSVLVVAILLVSNSVFATVQIPSANTTTTENTTATTENTVANTTANTTTVTPANNTTTLTTNTASNNTTSLPQTGETTDYVVMALIAVAAISAVVAYRKSKAYNA